MLTWLILGILVLSTSAAQAASVPEACRAFARGDAAGTKACQNHASFFELKSDFIEGCAQFSAELDIRVRCLKSGADLSALKLCHATGWSIDNMLTCLRAYPEADVLKHCQKIGGSEEQQVRCLRMGRDSSQIQGCTDFAPDASSRLQCLESNTTAFEMRRCEARHHNIRERFDCLDETVSLRDPSYQPRSLASQAQK